MVYTPRGWVARTAVDQAVGRPLARAGGRLRPRRRAAGDLACPRDSSPESVIRGPRRIFVSGNEKQDLWSRLRARKSCDPARARNFDRKSCFFLRDKDILLV